MEKLKGLIKNYSELEKNIGDLVDPIIKKIRGDIIEIFSSLIDELKREGKFDDVITLGIVIGDYVGGEICNLVTSEVIQFELEDKRYDDIL